MAERHSSAVQQVAGVGVQTVEDVRLTQSALWTPSGQITSRSGFVPTGTAAVPGSVLATSPTPNGFVHVQPYRYVMQSVRGGGVYELCLDAIKDINILGDQAADPSNARNDLIVSHQRDTYFGDPNSDMVVRHLIGTPSGSPLDPDPSAGGWGNDYKLHARVVVPAGATSITNANITNFVSGLTVATGGLLPVADATERAAIANPYDGMPIYRRDLDWNETYDGTAWRAPMFVKTAALANITNPVAGQHAMLTSDGFVYEYNGSAWVAVFKADGSMPRGRIASQVSNGAGDTLSWTTTESVGVALSGVPFVSGRRYEYQFTGVGNASTAGANMFLKIRYKAGATVDTSGSIVPDAKIAPNIARGNAGDNNVLAVSGELVCPTTGPYVVVLTGRMSAGTGGVPADASNHGWRLVIKDIGL